MITHSATVLLKAFQGRQGLQTYKRMHLTFSRLGRCHHVCLLQGQSIKRHAALARLLSFSSTKRLHFQLRRPLCTTNGLRDALSQWRELVLRSDRSWNTGNAFWHGVPQL